MGRRTSGGSWRREGRRAAALLAVSLVDEMVEEEEEEAGRSSKMESEHDINKHTIPFSFLSILLGTEGALGLGLLLSVGIMYLYTLIGFWICKFILKCLELYMYCR